MYIKEDRPIAQGKTKRLWLVVGNHNQVIVESLPNITAHDDATLTRQFEKKAEFATTTTVNCFKTLQRANLPVAFVTNKGLPTNEFLARRCQMIPIEIVIRRQADGSYLQRDPAAKKDQRFEPVVVEFFLKTTGGKLVAHDGTVIVEGLDPANKEEDPFIINPEEDVWKLFHPHKNSQDPEADLGRTVERKLITNKSPKELMHLGRNVFLVLEKAWKAFGFKLIDLKIEVGIDNDGALVVADVIDNDSWRLRDPEGQERSKQVFRDQGLTNEVIINFAKIAEQTEKFGRIPDSDLRP